MTRWRLSGAEASRRITEAALLGPRKALSGEPLAPVLPATAAAQALGLITDEHVKEIRKGIAKLPGFVDHAHPQPDRSGLGPQHRRHRPEGAGRHGGTHGLPPRSGRPGARRRRTRTPPRRVHRAATTQRDDPCHRRLHPRRVGDLGGPVREVRRRRHVQPRRREPLHLRYTDPRTDRFRQPHPGPAPPRRDGLHRPPSPHQDRTRTTQRAADHHHRAHHPPRPRIAGWDRRHRRRHPAPAQRRRQPRRTEEHSPLPRGVRPGHRLRPRLVPGPTHRVGRATIDADRPRRGLHQTALHGVRLRLVRCITPSSIGPTADSPTSTTTRWPVAATTAWSGPGDAAHPHQRPARSRVDPAPHLDTGQTRINDYHQPEKLRPPPDDAWTPPTPDDERAGDEAS